MTRIEQINDLPTAKQAALLLEKENARLHKKLALLLREIAKLKGEDGSVQLELELMKLQEQAALLRGEMFDPPPSAGRKITSQRKSRQRSNEVTVLASSRRCHTSMSSTISTRTSGPARPAAATLTSGKVNSRSPKRSRSSSDDS